MRFCLLVGHRKPAIRQVDVELAPDGKGEVSVSSGAKTQVPHRLLDRYDGGTMLAAAAIGTGALARRVGEMRIGQFCAERCEVEGSGHLTPRRLKLPPVGPRPVSLAITQKRLLRGVSPHVHAGAPSFPVSASDNDPACLQGVCRSAQDSATHRVTLPPIKVRIANPGSQRPASAPQLVRIDGPEHVQSCAAHSQTCTEDGNSQAQPAPDSA